MNKLKISLIASSLVLVGGLGSAVLWNGVANGEWDLPGLQQQVQHVTEVTDNHEGRITNLESKVNTPSDQPTPTPVVVTKVVTQAAPVVSVPTVPAPGAASAVTVAPTPVPVVVSWYREIGLYCTGATPVYGWELHWTDGAQTTQADEPKSGTLVGGHGSIALICH